MPIARCWFVCPRPPAGPHRGLAFPASRRAAAGAISLAPTLRYRRQRLVDVDAFGLGVHVLSLCARACLTSPELLRWLSLGIASAAGRDGALAIAGDAGVAARLALATGPAACIGGLRRLGYLRCVATRLGRCLLFHCRLGLGLGLGVGSSHWRLVDRFLGDGHRRRHRSARRDRLRGRAIAGDHQHAPARPPSESHAPLSRPRSSSWLSWSVRRTPETCARTRPRARTARCRRPASSRGQTR